MSLTRGRRNGAIKRHGQDRKRKFEKSLEASSSKWRKALWVGFPTPVCLAVLLFRFLFLEQPRSSWCTYFSHGMFYPACPAARNGLSTVTRPSRKFRLSNARKIISCRRQLLFITKRQNVRVTRGTVATKKKKKRWHFLAPASENDRVVCYFQIERRDSIGRTRYFLDYTVELCTVR